MANSLDVTALPAYIEQRDDIISKAVVGGKSINLFRLQTGIKTSAAINLLNTDVTFGDGKSCGWSAAGTQRVTQRQINTGNIKVELEYCVNELLDTWMQREVEIMAGRESLPFEQTFVDAVIADIQKKLEVAIYTGDTSKTSVPNTKFFDGLIKILTADGTKKDVSASGNMYSQLEAIWLAMPKGAYEMGDPAILVGEDAFQPFIANLVRMNLYHYDPADGQGVIRIPGTTVRVIAVPGLNGTGKAIAGSMNNIVFGCDLRNASERVESWYDKTADDFKLRVRFNAGVQVAFPDEVILATINTTASTAAAASEE